MSPVNQCHGVLDMKGTLKAIQSALARLLSWLECLLTHQKVMGSIPSQDTYLGCLYCPIGVHVGGNQSKFLIINISFSLLLSLKVNRHILK